MTKRKSGSQWQKENAKRVCHCEERSDAAVSSNSTHSIFYFICYTVYLLMRVTEYVIATPAFGRLAMTGEEIGSQ